MKEIKEIIKTLKKALENAHLIENDIIEVIFDSNDLEWLLQALEEQPFCDSCEWSSDSEGMGNGLYCDNKESTLGEMSIIDDTTSCLYHSGRKELTEQQKLFSQITEKDIEEFIEYIIKRKEKK
ncbi:MAG: hypothetical protein H8E98_06370 [Bacteroidetes bacterium]|nr:hypothetical protein [Bacteroidota bacterium]